VTRTFLTFRWATYLCYLPSQSISWCLLVRFLDTTATKGKICESTSYVSESGVCCSLPVCTFFSSHKLVVDIQAPLVIGTYYCHSLIRVYSTVSRSPFPDRRQDTTIMRTPAPDPIQEIVDSLCWVMSNPITTTPITAPVPSPSPVVASPMANPVTYFGLVAECNGFLWGCIWWFHWSKTIHQAHKQSLPWHAGVFGDQPVSVILLSMPARVSQSFRNRTPADSIHSSVYAWVTVLAEPASLPTLRCCWTCQSCMPHTSTTTLGEFCTKNFGSVSLPMKLCLWKTFNEK